MPQPPTTGPFVERRIRLVTAPATDKIFAGIGLILSSTVFFCAGDIAAKAMTEPCRRYRWHGCAMSCSAASSSRWRSPLTADRRLSTPRPVLQILRGLAVVISSVFFMFGLGHLQVAEATAINFISPVFITALSIPLLGEKVGIHDGPRQRSASSA